MSDAVKQLVEMLNARPEDVFGLVIWSAEEVEPDERLGPEGLCFKNAAERISMPFLRTRYVEGYAESESVPGLWIRHAWLELIDSGRVIDPTWQTPTQRMGFRTRGAINIMVQRGVWGISDAYGTQITSFPAWELQRWRDADPYWGRH